MMAMDIVRAKICMGQSKRNQYLEKTIAAAMRKSLEKGSLYSLETLLTRVYGKPKETVDTTNKTELTGKIQVEVITSGVPLANRETDV
jgi:pantothenate synthetase